MTKVPLWRDLLMTFQGIAKYEFFLKRSQFWSEDQMEKYQYKKLRKLLIESYHGTKYYNQLFKNIQFNPELDFKSISDLNKIPILTKIEAKKNRDALINPKYVKNSIMMRTSGSTGNPFEVAVSFNAWVMEQAVVWRHWAWGGYKFRDQLAMVRSFTPKANEALYKTDRIRNFTFYSPFHLNNINMEMYLKVMIEKKTTILRGYPSSIATLAKYVCETNAQIPPIKLILTASEQLSDNERELIETAFQAKISNHYGLAEVCVMMGDCEKHEGLHNYSEYGYLELLLTDNDSIRSIIGTNLHNLAMPLIRYETGDLAQISQQKCSCNRVLPTIHNVIGRKDSNIKTLEGYTIPTVNFYTMFESYNEISQWQIVQHSLTRIQFIIHAKELPNGRIKELKAEIAKRLPQSVDIIISINEEFVKVFEGKQNPFISKISEV